MRVHRVRFFPNVKDRGVGYTYLFWDLACEFSLGVEGSDWWKSHWRDEAGIQCHATSEWKSPGTSHVNVDCMWIVQVDFTRLRR